MIHQIKHIKKKIITLLREKPHLRDDDNKLIANIWCEETGKDEKGVSITRQTTARDFLYAFASGQYTSPESIRRARQKVQEQNPELRGKSYKNRKKNATEIRQQIHTV
jgi:hypothetical protein